MGRFTSLRNSPTSPAWWTIRWVNGYKMQLCTHIKLPTIYFQGTKWEILALCYKTNWLKEKTCVRCVSRCISRRQPEMVKPYCTCCIHINPRPAGGQRAPCGLSQIAPEVLGISLWNFPYLSGQQFHTLCQKIMTQVIIGQPWVTSEWRYVSPILTNKMGLRNRRHWCNFKATINWLIWNDV